jgi:hypothetical protein
LAGRSKKVSELGDPAMQLREVFHQIGHAVYSMERGPGTGADG